MEMRITELPRKYSNDWDHVKIVVEDQLIKLDSYSESKVDGFHVVYRFDGTLVEDNSSTPVPASMIIDDLIRDEGKSFIEAIVALYDFEVSHLTAIDEKEKAEAEKRRSVATEVEQILLTCPKCDGDIQVPKGTNLDEIAVDCPICNRIIECDEW